jgi:hypothetical protein
MAKVFSSLSKPEEIHRIDRLELDIGKIHGSFPESVFLNKVEKALRQELTQKFGKVSAISPVPTKESSKKQPNKSESLRALAM